MDAVRETADLREQFWLDPSVIFLNHGAFGACPRPVFEAYQHWQRELERQPVEFIARRLANLLAEAKVPLARYVNAPAADLVFVPNATAAVNIVARSLRLERGDEVLTTDHEYGACIFAWNHALEKRGARLVEQSIPLPVTTPDAVIDALWQGVTERTRVIFISHVTSSTALIFPVAEVIRRAREQGILTFVDGAHVPGHLPLDLTALAPDFYTGNLHKWLCAPKGSAFLYVRPEYQSIMEPLYISWGWVPGASFTTRMEMQGTRDSAAYLAVPAAIAFLERHNWDAVRARCHALLSEARARIGALTGLEQIAPQSGQWYCQMASVPLPPCDPQTLASALMTRYRIEIPIIPWRDYIFARVSVQGYNTSSDLIALVNALEAIFA